MTLSKTPAANATPHIQRPTARPPATRLRRFIFFCPMPMTPTHNFQRPARTNRSPTRYIIGTSRQKNSPAFSRFAAFPSNYVGNLPCCSSSSARLNSTLLVKNLRLGAMDIDLHGTNVGEYDYLLSSAPDGSHSQERR